MLLPRAKKLKKHSRMKPFGFCCSMDHFDSLSKYNQQRPPYKSSLPAISSVHECPVSKMRMEYFTRIFRRKKSLIRSRVSNAKEQQQLNDELNYFQINKNNGSIKWYLEDEIALAKDIFWTKKQRIHKKASNKALTTAKKKIKNQIKNILNVKCPRWYQDFSLDQMKNLMNLEKVIRADYKEMITHGTQTTLMAIGVTSTFFKLKPNIIKELHQLSRLNSVDFLRHIYKILTGNDFYEERYKKIYDCNERIILSAIAFLTLPETVIELHRRLPTVVMPKLSPKPKPLYPKRRRSSCPYNEELFRRFDWAAHRNSLQKWQKQYKLLAIPKVILPFREQDRLFMNNKMLSRIKKQEKDISIEYLKEMKTKLQKISDIKFDRTGKNDILNIDERIKYKDKDFLGEEGLETEKSAFDIYRSDDDKKSDYSITDLHKKLEAVEYKSSNTLKPPGMCQRSWLGEKTALYAITGISEDHPSTYEIAGVVNVTPTNSDERFFAMLKCEGYKKTFPSGRENLSKNWQEWLQNVEEEFSQVQEKADELIKSVQATTKFLQPICDSCCSCRQTRKAREKFRQTKTPHLLIDNVVQDEGKKKYSVKSIAMHSPGPSPTGSPINLLEESAMQDEIKTQIIIDGVAYENGKIQYNVSGVQEDKVHVPSRVPDVLSAPPASQPIINIPPCECAIKQMINKDASPSTSKDDIPWTRDEGLCPGKKYRPDEPGAYSCKMYPGDKSCRRNPFMKEIVQIRNKERVKEEEEKRKAKAETVDVVKEEIQVPKKTAVEKSGFTFDPDYLAYNPWDISRTAPSAEIVDTDYEASLKLTSPTLPATSMPLRMHERQKDILNMKSKIVKNNTLHKKTNRKNLKVFLKPSKNIQKKRNKVTEDLKNTKKRRNESSKNTTKDESKLTTKIFKSTIINKIKERQTKSLKKSFKRKDNFAYNSEESRKEEMTRLKNMFRFPAEILDDIQPAILPKELSGEQRELTDDSLTPMDKEEKDDIEKRPCGWRTRSEQELPAKKTLAYLCEPDYPLETMPVRPGGRPCHCRENRSKKKILMYNVSGVVEKKIGGMRATKPKLEEENRVIDGVVYVTPPPSPRRSDEYIPEYDLLDSPYDMCVGETADEQLKLIEKYSGPKSLVEKIHKKPKSCNCTDNAKKDSLDQKKDIEEARQKLMESKLPEERWRMALKDAALMDYFTQRKDNAPCWTSCKKFARSIRPRRLKVMKPVCECKNERKIVERNEERAKWKARQRKLKALKKEPFMHIVDISRPMVKDTTFVLSEVKKTWDEDGMEYHISDVTETVSMAPPQRIVDGLKMSTPVHTPEPSKEDILQAAVHRHWSPMDIPPGPLPKKDAALKAEIDHRNKARDEAFRLIYETKSGQDSAHLLSKISSRMEYQKDELRKEIAGEKIDEKKQYPEEVYQRDALHKKIIEKAGEKIGDEATGDSDKELKDNKFNLIAIMKTELKKMAVEGYAFAKLPECYLMPQLQDWIMYRKGIAFSEIDKKKLMEKSFATWELIDTLRMPKIEVPSLNMTRHQLRSLTYDQARKIKKKIEEKRAIFQSAVRKSRVLYSHSMWNTMEAGKFPSTSFKRTYFTYMPGKEADGHVYKPWRSSEISKADPDFSCY